MRYASEQAYTTLPTRTLGFERGRRAGTLAVVGGYPGSPGMVSVLLNISRVNMPTAITVVSSLNPVAEKEVVTYTATVTSQSGGTN
jgi:hypothetical protein